MPSRRVLEPAEYTVADTLPGSGDRRTASCPVSGYGRSNAKEQSVPTTNQTLRPMLVRWRIRALRWLIITIII